MKSKTIIEVNGKRYDATTGAVIGEGAARPVTTGRNIDGFFRSHTRHALQTEKAEKSAGPVTVHAAHITKPHSQTSRSVNHAKAHTPQSGNRVAVRTHATISQSAKSDSHHIAVTVNHAKRRAPQSSKTLMRTSVQRPNPSFRAQASAAGALQHAVPSLIVTKASVAAVDNSRLSRAQDTPRSRLISHHGSDAVPVVTAMFAPVAVQPIPAAPAPPSTPPAKPGNEEPTAPAPNDLPNSKPTDIFEHALSNATHFVDVHAHTKHFKKQVRRHMVSMASGTLALVMIAGFAAYQNTPGLQFKVASIRAGVTTNMPNFEAAGFAYNGARAENGKLTVGFSDKQGTFQMVQQPTNLTAGEVMENIGSTTAGGQPTYHAIHADGTVVYRFSNTDATWVSGGTWYTVNGTGALSDAQVTSLVQNI